MSHLGYIEKLLDGVEVEWKELWQVTIWDKKFNAVERDKQPRVIKYHSAHDKKIIPTLFS
ncbi:hypothetical protein [Psychrobacter sanguinis]|uniref:hypothetical protein n=1 Tax=Psychrobacter sanguinis TaxID=861445 RepID=UPI00191B37FD